MLAQFLIVSVKLITNKQVTYADVEPVMQEKYAGCHTGNDKGVVASGFTVESCELLMKGAKLGPDVVTG